MASRTEIGSAETASAARAVSSAVAASDFRRAYEVADTAISQGVIHPALFSARAMWLERQKRDREALADFERAASLDSGNVALLNAIGLCLVRMDRVQEALSSFDEAIALNPTYTLTYHRKALALQMKGDIAGAQRMNEQAVRLNPHDVNALASLASIWAHKGDAKKALEYSERALRLDPRQATAMAARALIAAVQGHFVEAEAILRRLLERPELAAHARVGVLGLLADSLDGQDRVADAFAAYRNQNEELLQMRAANFPATGSIADSVRALLAAIELIPQQPSSPQDDAGYGQPSQHVFVVGFFRSGTTLLRQVIAHHPDVVTLAEHDLLLDPAKAFLSDVAGMAKLASLSENDLAAMREDYWRKIGESTPSLSGKVLIDENPLHTLKLPLIAKLFPRARIILALRDPRDIVLSCFRGPFDVGAARGDLLTLDGAAAAFDAVMNFALSVQPMIAQPYLLNRYEDWVSDPHTAIDTLCTHLGLPVDTALHELYTKSIENDIRTPSAARIVRPLYREDVGQWRRYRAQLEPVLPILGPWIEKFGYSAE